MNDATRTQNRRAATNATAAKRHLEGDSLRAWVDGQLELARAADAKGATDDAAYFRRVAQLAST